MICATSCGAQPTKFMVEPGPRIDEHSHDGGTMCVSKLSLLEMAHGAITVGLGLPLTTLDSRTADSIFTVWCDPPNGNSVATGKNRLPNCVTVTLAFAPIEYEVAFVSQSNVLFSTSPWNGAPTPPHLTRGTVLPMFAPSGGTTSRKSLRAERGF